MQCKDHYTARLESQLDQMEKEYQELEHMLIQVGFEEGIRSLKESVITFLEEGGGAE